jgi:argininosuccinate lyase
VSQKTWGGRFQEATNPEVEQFTQSISVDQRLYRHDIEASIAHAQMLAQVGLISPHEAEALTQALETIRGEIENGQFVFQARLEDIHTHIEQALIARLGDVGRKLHTGRSRNDQVATAMKLWTRDAIRTLLGQVRSWQRALLEAAERWQDLILPGYTHWQRAQPILAAHYFLAYLEKFERDRGRLQDCLRRLDELPLGTAALAGTSLPIDREAVRQRLGFSRLAENSLDASSDRDFVLEFVFCLAMLAAHLSGWAEEWIVWSTVEFGFLDLPEAYCTGSSIMPHKKNPDVLELIRAKAARIMAHVQRLLVLVKGLPLAYNRDLQEDKEALFDAYDTVSACLQLAAGIVAASRFRPEAIAQRLEEGFLDATTLMEYLVLQGLPLRTAHEVVGKLVRRCEERGCRLADLPAEEYDAIRPGLGSGVYQIVGVRNAVRAFRSLGSTGPAEVARQLQRWRGKLDEDSEL